MKNLFDKFFTSHPLSLIWNIVCFNASGTCSSARASACNKIQQAQQLISFQYFCLWLPLRLAPCPAFQYFSSNPVGTCENIMKKGLRTVRSFLRFSAQNLGKRRKEERIKHHNNQHRVNEINEFDRSHLRYLYSHIYFFTIFHITPDHTGSTNSSPSPTIHQTACFAVSCSNCLNSSAQVWRCWTWTKIQRKHIKTLERAA